MIRAAPDLTTHAIPAAGYESISRRPLQALAKDPRARHPYGRPLSLARVRPFIVERLRKQPVEVMHATFVLRRIPPTGIEA